MRSKISIIRTGLILASVIGSIGAFARTASADVVTLTFEGIGNDQPIGNYYGGGAGPNYGISFGSDSRLSSPTGRAAQATFPIRHRDRPLHYS